MNKYVKIKGVVATILCAATFLAFGDTEVVDGVTWTYTVKDGEASVGGGSTDTPAIPTTTTGAITIPSTLGKCPVTSIGSYAFLVCRGLTSVRIPSSVTSIGNYAFANCSGLRSFEVDAQNPNYKAVNGLLLTKDGETLVAGVNGDGIIPEGVTSIGMWAFSGRSALTSVRIPSSVTSIGSYAFSDCSGLTSVTLASAVPPGIEVNSFTGYTGKFYVPSGSKAAYDSAEGWSAYAANIVELAPVEFAANSFVRRPNVIGGDGYVDQLAFRVTVSNHVANSVLARVSGTLLGGNGAAVAEFSSDCVLAAGAKYVTITFNGHTIRETGVAGPYTLSSIRLESLDMVAFRDSIQPTVVVDDVALEDFGVRPFAVSGEPTLRDGDVDNPIALDVPISVAREDEVTLVAELTDPTGEIVAHSEAVFAVSAGETRVLSLGFTLQDLIAAGKEGPYVVQNVTLQSGCAGMADIVLSDYRGTSNYKITMYVDANTGDDANDGLSRRKAKATLSAAVAASGVGYVISAAPGDYEPLDVSANDAYVNVDKRLSIVASAGDPAKTRLVGLGTAVSARGFYLADGAVLSGFTVTNCAITTGNGGGVYGESRASAVTNCIIAGCSTRQDGGGAYGCGVYDSTLVGNEGLNGGGAASSLLERCVIWGNRATGGAADTGLGGGMYAGDSRNCLVRGNVANCGGGMSGGVAYNCTIVENAAARAGGAHSAALHNSIIFENVSDTGYDDVVDCICRYCCGPSLEGEGCFLGAPPHFVDPEAGDYSLLRYSPCVNAGSLADVVSEIDLAGEPRVARGMVDLGAYELAEWNWCNEQFGSWDVEVDPTTGETLFKSPALEDGETFSVFLRLRGNGVFSFDWQTRGSDAYEYRGEGARAEFYLDGVRVAYLCGDSAWETVCVDVGAAGEHVAEWVYHAAGEDAADGFVTLRTPEYAPYWNEPDAFDLADAEDYNWFYEDEAVDVDFDLPAVYEPATTLPEETIVRVDVKTKPMPVDFNSLNEIDVRDCQGCLVEADDASGRYAVLTANGWETVVNDAITRHETEVCVSMTVDYGVTPSRIRYAIDGHTLTNAAGNASFACAVQKGRVTTTEFAGTGRVSAWGGAYAVRNADVLVTTPGEETVLTPEQIGAAAELRVAGGGTLVIPGDIIPAGGFDKKLHVDAGSRLKIDYTDSVWGPRNVLFRGLAADFALNGRVRVNVPNEGIDRLLKMYLADGILEARIAERPSFAPADGQPAIGVVRDSDTQSTVTTILNNAVTGFWYGLETAPEVKDAFTLDPTTVTECTEDGTLPLASSAIGGEHGFYRVRVEKERFE